MGHAGMLYSLPSRDLIADSVEYMANAHRVDALVCISNCDKITPGMLMAAMRLNIPAIFVSGGPMEAGRRGGRRYDLVDAMVASADESVDETEMAAIEAAACPTCGSCSGMFTANSMNCLAEALGMALPGNGTVVATHERRLGLFDAAAVRIVEMADRYYGEGDASVLPRSIASRAAFMNAMALDIAMGGSTNTVLHLLAIAHEAHVDFTMADIDGLSRRTPCLCKVAPSSPYHVEDVNRAGGIHGILGELARAGLLDTTVKRADGLTLKQALAAWDIRSPSATEQARALHRAAPGGKPTLVMGSQSTEWPSLGHRPGGRVHPRHRARLPGRRRARGADGQPRGARVHREDRGRGRLDPPVPRPGAGVRLAGSACTGILGGAVKAGDVVVIRYEGPRGGPGMQEMLYPTSYLKAGTSAPRAPW